MKKVIYNTHGSADVLEIVETETPVRSGDDVLIELRAVSINPLDWKLRNGMLKIGTRKNLNRAIGIDFSGVISAVSGRGRFNVGDEVFGGVKDSMKQGVLGEYAVVAPDQLAHKPDNISHSQAAAMTSVGAPAIVAIEEKAQVSPDQQVLINGAGGGVGMIAVQIAKRAGATVTAVAGTRALPHLQGRRKVRVVTPDRHSPWQPGCTTSHCVLTGSGFRRWQAPQQVGLRLCE